MSKTTTDLATETMRLLGILEAQETVSSEDEALITQAYTDKFAELQLLEMTYWPVDVIPSEIFRALARIIAEDVASSFGEPIPTEFDHGGRPVSMGTKGLFDLKRIIQRHSSQLPTPSMFY